MANRHWIRRPLSRGTGVAIVVTLLLSASVGAQTPAPEPSAIDDTIQAGEASAEAPARELVKWNHYQGPLGSIRMGAGYLLDYATYAQDENSKEQFDLSPDLKLRDFRMLFSGRLGFSRPTTWSMGYMYDAGADKWVFRQTGIMVEVPELWGHIFVGRTKEGFSLNKVMVGYAGWTMERSPISDATLPILADGVKWLGYVPKARVIWNLGFYGDAISEGESFSSYENQLSGRLAWVPVLSPDGSTLLHLGLSARRGKVNSDTLRLKARPGAWPAPFFVDTSEFAAESTSMTGLEVYFRPGKYTFGSEYFFQNVDAPGSGNPLFHGGEVVMSWLITGERRTYNTRGGYFNMVSPARPVVSGGPGAWEILAHFAYIDLDSQAITGGKFWRVTPMMNWYLTDHVRLEVAYGYSATDRFGVVGKTHFFQSRLQLQM